MVYRARHFFGGPNKKEYEKDECKWTSYIAL